MKLTREEMKLIDAFRRCTNGNGCAGCPYDKDAMMCCELPGEISRILDRLTGDDGRGRTSEL